MEPGLTMRERRRENDFIQNPVNIFYFPHMYKSTEKNPVSVRITSIRENDFFLNPAKSEKPPY